MTNSNYKTQTYTAQQAARIIGIAADAEQGIAPRRDYGTFPEGEYTFEDLRTIGAEIGIDLSESSLATREVEESDVNNQRALNLEEMLTLSKEVLEWRASQGTTVFNNLSQGEKEFLGYLEGCSNHVARWDYEGQAGGNTVLLDKSSANRLWSPAYQIAVMHDGNVVGCSGRIPESKSRELRHLYKTIEGQVREKQGQRGKEEAEAKRKSLIEGAKSARTKLVGGTG